MSVHITKYTKPTGCGQCFASDRALGVQKGSVPQSKPKKIVPHTTVEFTPELADHFRDVVQAPQAPVFVIRDIDSAEIIDFWTGFRPDKISQWSSDATDAPEGDERFEKLPQERPRIDETVSVAS